MRIVRARHLSMRRVAPFNEPISTAGSIFHHAKELKADVENIAEEETCHRYRWPSMFWLQFPCFTALSRARFVAAR